MALILINGEKISLGRGFSEIKLGYLARRLHLDGL